MHFSLTKKNILIRKVTEFSQNGGKISVMGFQATPNNTDKEDGYSDAEEHKIETV